MEPERPMGQWVASNHNNADEYVGSAWPCVKNLSVSSTVKKIEFPTVTQFLTFHNNEHGESGNKDLYVAFSEIDFDENTNYFIVHPGEVIGNLPVKCKDIWIKSAGDSIKVCIIAGVTNVPRRNFPNHIGLEMTVIP
jgi:hypothetical protein